MSRYQQATYRNIPFAVLGAEGEFGRRNAVHEYPYRDTVWVEDLGRSARKIELVGFLISDSRIYKGGPVADQHQQMIAAVESPGDGELIHPTLGRLMVSIIRFGTTERWDGGRVVEIAFSFIEAGSRLFPSNVTSTGSAVSAAADAADAAASADFSAVAAAPLKAAPASLSLLATAGAAIKEGAAVVNAAVSTVTTWARSAQRLVNDATNLYNMVGSLPGTFGRYFGGRRRGGLSNALSGITATANSISGLISIGTVTRNNISNTVSNISSLAGRLGL